MEGRAFGDYVHRSGGRCWRLFRLEERYEKARKTVEEDGQGDDERMGREDESVLSPAGARVWLTK